MLNSKENKPLAEDQSLEGGRLPQADLPPKEDSLSEEDSLKLQLATLKARLERGEIDGKTYNQLCMALVPAKQSKSDRLEYLERGRNESRERHTLRWLLLGLALASIPFLWVGVWWKYYFENTLTGAGLPDLGEVPVSTIENDPIQIDLVEPVSETGEYRGIKLTMTYRAYYDITATVLARKNYYQYLNLHEGGFFDTISMSDLCLGWGEMRNILTNPNWRFRNTYIFSPASIYSYKYARSCEPKYVGEDYGLDSQKFVATNFSNNHLIFASKEVRNTVFGMRKGNVVRLVGYLVDVESKRGSLTSSLTREDHSAGGYRPVGCEVFYVMKAEILAKSYKGQ